MMSAYASSTVSSSIHALFTFCLLGSFSAEPVGTALLHLHPYSTSMGRLFGKQSTVDHHSNSWDVLLREVTAMHTCSMNSLKVHSSQVYSELAGHLSTKWGVIPVSEYSFSYFGIWINAVVA